MIRVLGLGNVLMSDDGLGPFVVRVLEATYECPAGVEFLDAGTPGLDLTPYLLGADAVIFVDTVSASGAPGEIRVYDRDAILKVPPQARTGGHDPALKEALLTVAAAGGGPARVTRGGAIPGRGAAGGRVSPRPEGAGGAGGGGGGGGLGFRGAAPGPGVRSGGPSHRGGGPPAESPPPGGELVPSAGDADAGNC